MKISLEWLNTYLSAPVSADVVDDLLTGHGFPVEGREEITGGDVMLDVEVTSNRGDVLSHVGVAREVVAALAGTGAGTSTPEQELKRPAAALPEAVGPAVGESAAVEVRDAEGCPLYTARVIRGVKVGPSPAWLTARLQAVGLRSVNNVVDVTNFVLLESGQPLHAFDLGKLAGGRVVVRGAAAGEPFAALDGTTHKLRAGSLVIADDRRPVALAGVMGGADSGVTEATTDVLLESGIFDPLVVRASSRGHKLQSDSSFRFERGVDPCGVEVASRRAAALIAELTGGVVADGVIRTGADEPAPATLTLRAERTQALLGIPLGAEEQAEYLQRLELDPRCSSHADDDVIHVTVPTFRLDLTREVDLIEEVARLHGMENIPVNEKIEIAARAPQAAVKARRAATDVLVARGFCETITFSFTRPEWAGAFLTHNPSAGGSPEGQVRLAGDHKKDEPTLRPSVLPSLLQCRKVNQDAGNAGVRLFEWASTWRQGDPMHQESATVETRKLALLMDAEPGKTGLEVGVRTLRGTLNGMVAALGGGVAADGLTVEPMDRGGAATGPFECAGAVSIQGRALGVMGLVSDATRELFGVTVPQLAAELDAAALLALYPAKGGLEALPKYPGIERDLSVVVDEAVAWRDIAGAVEGALPRMLVGVTLEDVYRGKPVAKGQKSVSFRMQFRDPDATLRHEQVDPQVAVVVGALREKVGATCCGSEVAKVKSEK